MIRPLDEAGLTLDEVGILWDAIADERAGHFARGIDVSMEDVIIPQLVSLLSSQQGGRVLDAGCGLGALTRALHDLDFEVTGVDVSEASIRLAREFGAADIVYHSTSVEEHAIAEPRSFDAVVANMSLMAAPDLDGFAGAAFRLCRGARSLLAVSLTHPVFWPRYWEYESDPEFDYTKELLVTQSFRISNADTGIETVHIHRPIERYVEALTSAGFQILRLLEPIPGPDVEARYEEPWKYPRFLFVLAIVP